MAPKNKAVENVNKLIKKNFVKSGGAEWRRALMPVRGWVWGVVAALYGRPPMMGREGPTNTD